MQASPPAPPTTARSDLTTPMEHKQMMAGGDNAMAGGRRQRSRRPVPINSYRDVRPTLLQMINQMDFPALTMLERKTGMNREQLFYIICGFMALWLMVGPGNGLLCNLIGVAYPMYQSVLAVRTERKDDDTHWLIYWCAYAFISLADFIAEPINRALPLYWLAKTVFLLYLAAPQTFGAYNIYIDYVDPLVDWLSARLRQHGIVDA